MQGDDVIHELKSARKFNALFGDRATKWVESQMRQDMPGQMSDHGWNLLREKRKIAAIVRYILVAYERGSFFLGMIEYEIITWPSGQCNCTPDEAISFSFKETIEDKARRVMYVNAPRDIVLIPNPFDEEESSSGD